MFDELKEVKYFNEITNFKTLEIKCLESLQVKTEAYLEPKASIYDGTFLWIYSTAYYSCNKGLIIDVWLCYI